MGNKKGSAKKGRTHFAGQFFHRKTVRLGLRMRQLKSTMR